jgi:hypothetical protein
MFLPPPSDDNYLDVKLLDEVTPGELENVDLVPFTYNPLHDLESIWWIATFFVFHHFTTGGHDRHLLDIDVAKLFPATDYLPRKSALASKKTFMRMARNLPAGLQQHGKGLNICRQNLFRAYRSAESMANISKAAFEPEVYQTFRPVFEQLRKDPGCLKAILNPLANAEGQDNRGEVDKSFEDVKSSPSVRKKDQQASTSIATLRCLTRPRKAVYAQQTMSDDDEDIEPNPGTRKRKKVKVPKDDQSYRAAGSSKSARKRKKVTNGT